jgi:uncharacterized protein YbjT (DUF2867 family)
MSSKVILVTGATGNQGTAVIKALQETDFQIRALVRDPKSSKAASLRAQGIELAVGDLDDSASLVRAMREAWGVFSVVNFTKGGVDKAAKRSMRIADAAKKADIKHFVFSSVGGAERRSGVPHFEAMWRVEKHIRTLSIPYTILRPTAFMVNLMEAAQPLRFMMMSVYRGLGKTLQMVAVEDVGKWVAHIFMHRAKYLGKAVEIAGDDVSYGMMAKAYRKTYGKVPRNIKFPIALFRGGDMGKMIQWFDKHGYKADIRANHQEVPGMLTYEEFVAKKELGAKL